MKPRNFKAPELHENLKDGIKHLMHIDDHHDEPKDSEYEAESMNIIYDIN